MTFATMIHSLHTVISSSFGQRFTIIGRIQFTAWSLLWIEQGADSMAIFNVERQSGCMEYSTPATTFNAQGYQYYDSCYSDLHISYSNTFMQQIWSSNLQILNFQFHHNIHRLRKHHQHIVNIMALLYPDPEKKIALNLS